MPAEANSAKFAFAAASFLWRQWPRLGPDRLATRFDGVAYFVFGAVDLEVQHRDGRDTRKTDVSAATDSQ